MVPIKRYIFTLKDCVVGDFVVIATHLNNEVGASVSGRWSLSNTETMKSHFAL